MYTFKTFNHEDVAQETVLPHETLLPLLRTTLPPPGVVVFSVLVFPALPIDPHTLGSPAWTGYLHRWRYLCLFSFKYWGHSLSSIR